MDLSGLRLRVAPAWVLCVFLALAGCASTPVGEVFPRRNLPSAIIGNTGSRTTCGAASCRSSMPRLWRYRGARRESALTTSPRTGAANGLTNTTVKAACAPDRLYREPPRSFNPPAQLLAFPLDQGKTWRQTIDTLSKDTELNDQIIIYGSVDTPGTTNRACGQLRAVYVYRIVQLDDEEFWRTRTLLRAAIWYAPEVKGPCANHAMRNIPRRTAATRRRSAPKRSRSSCMSFRPGGK